MQDAAQEFIQARAADWTVVQAYTSSLLQSGAYASPSDVQLAAITSTLLLAVAVNVVLALLVRRIGHWGSGGYIGHGTSCRGAATQIPRGRPLRRCLLLAPTARCRDRLLAPASFSCPRGARWCWTLWRRCWPSC